MIVKRIPAGVYAANCYILMDEETKETAVIDPGGDFDDIKKSIIDIDGTVQYVMLTHGHFDHTGAVKECLREFNVPLYVNRHDAEYMHNNTYTFGELEDGDFYNCSFIKDGDVLKLGETEVICIATPGHTLGGMCFKVENQLFSGDTLFLNSIGRSDLPGGDPEVLVQSINEKLIILDEDTEVFPGHGGSSKIKYEKHHNPYLN